MAGKKRWVKKGAPKKKGWKRTGRTRKTVSKSEVLNDHVLCKTIKHIGMLFPDRFCTKFKYSQQLGFEAITTTKAFGLGGNFLHNANTLTITGANPFSNLVYNQPLAMQGINLMIGNPNNNVGIYNTYRVNASSIKLTVSAYPTAANPNCAPFYVSIMPVSLEALGTDSLGNVNTWSVPQFKEYPLSKVTSVAVSHNKGTTISNHMTTAQIYALKYKSSLEDSNYYAQYGSNPLYNWGWVCALFTDTNLEAIDCDILETITYDIEFFNRNTLASGTV